MKWSEGVKGVVVFQKGGCWRGRQQLSGGGGCGAQTYRLQLLISVVPLTSGVTTATVENALAILCAYVLTYRNLVSKCFPLVIAAKTELLSFLKLDKERTQHPTRRSPDHRSGYRLSADGYPCELAGYKNLDQAHLARKTEYGAGLVERNLPLDITCTQDAREMD